MSHEAKVALERIITLCSKARSDTKRIRMIYTVAMEGVGMTASQRRTELVKLRMRIVDDIATRRALHENKSEIEEL